MNSWVHCQCEVRAPVIGAHPGSVHTEADRGMHERANHLIFVFDKNDLCLALRWSGRRGLALFCFDVEFHFVVAAGIRQSRSPDPPSTGKKCAEKKCTKARPHRDSPEEQDARSNGFHSTLNEPAVYRTFSQAASSQAGIYGRWRH